MDAHLSDTEPKWLRIADLERLSGTSRRTIHFYIRDGLLHPPIKTGKTMAYYDGAHLRKLAHIRKARQQGKPLIAIREEIAAPEFGQKDPMVKPLTESLRSNKEFHVRQPLPKREKGKKTREAIIELGCALFRQKGYRNTRINDITRALNIGKGTFYFYFTDKKELFLECVPRIFQELFAKGWDRIRKINDPQKRLELRAQTVLPVLREFCSILQLSKEALEDPDPKLKKLGEQTYLSIRRPLEIDIQRGLEQGLFHDLDPKTAGTLMIGIMESLYYSQVIDKKPVSAKTWQDVLALILFGMKGRGV